MVRFTAHVWVLLMTWLQKKATVKDSVSFIGGNPKRESVQTFGSGTAERYWEEKKRPTSLKLCHSLHRLLWTVGISMWQ